MSELKCAPGGPFDEVIGIRLSRGMVEDLETLRSKQQIAEPYKRVSRADVLRRLIIEKSATPTLAALEGSRSM